MRKIEQLATDVACDVTGLEPSTIDPASIILILEALFGFIEQCQEKQRIASLGGRLGESRFLTAFATSRIKRELSKMDCSDCGMNHSTLANAIVKKYGDLDDATRLEVVIDYVEPDFSMS